MVTSGSLMVRLPVSMARLWSALLAHCTEISDLHPEAEKTSIIERDATTLYRRAEGPGLEVTERVSIDERRHRVECETISGGGVAAGPLRYRIMAAETAEESSLVLQIASDAGGQEFLETIAERLRRRLEAS